MSRDQHVPESLHEAILYFSDPDVCLEFMVHMRWPDGVICPLCQGKEHSFLTTRRMWKCKSCKKQFSVKVGTLLEDSPIKLDKWLCAIWLIGNAKNGISSYEIHRALGVTQKTAWFMLHRIRTAMRTGTFEKMKGEVEADETYIGGKAANMHKKERAEKIKGRGAVGKSVVMGLLQRHEEGSSEVSAKMIKDTSRKTLHSEIKANVEAGSFMLTDALPSYVGISPEFYHQAIDHAEAYVRDEVVHTNGLENFWSLFKRCIKGTYVSADPWHLQKYIDEEVFRFNARRLTDADRFLLMTRALKGKRLTYKQLTGYLSEEEAQTG